MVFTLQFQQFSAARGQWLTDVLVVKDLKFWTVMRYIPRIIAWISPHQHISRRGIVQRVVWTQGTVIDDKPACPKCGATQLLDPQAGLYCSKRCWSSLKLVA